MWTGVLILSSLLALGSTDMQVENVKTPCELQEDENVECNTWEMLTERKVIPRLDYAYRMSKPPVFLCKGPGCIMTFIKKSVQNRKRNGETDKKETTFYSGW